jgi:hypothetical protein
MIIVMADNDTKRPHFIPLSYLRAWAGEGDQVAVRRRSGPNVFTPNIINIAVDSGIYGRGDAGRDRERMFGRLEAEWPRLRKALISRGGALDEDDRSTISLFSATQLSRTRERVAQAEFLQAFADFSDRRPVTQEDVRTFLVECHLRFEPSDAEVKGAWIFASFALNDGKPQSKDEVMAMLLHIAVDEIRPRLAMMSGWTVEHCRKAVLLTSDRPVMCWRPRSLRDSYQGIGVETAEEIRWPLTPQDLLVMRPRARDGGLEQVSTQRFERVNAGVASQCHEFIVGTLSCRQNLQFLPMEEYRPVLRFNVGPGVRQLSDVREEAMGEILHMWLPVHATKPRR